MKLNIYDLMALYGKHLRLSPDWCQICRKLTHQLSYFDIDYAGTIEY